MKLAGVVTAIALGALMLLAAPVTSWAGGTLDGKVSFSGTPTGPKEFPFSKYANAKFCMKNPNKNAKGESRLLHEVEVGKDGGLKNAIVAVTGIDDEKFQAEFKGEDIIVELCEFKTYTGVVVANQSSFRMVNTDADPDDPKSVTAVLHNGRAIEVKGTSGKTMWNIVLQGKSKGDKPIKLHKAAEGSIFKLICDQHWWEQFWALPVTSPYYAIVGEDGKFSIEDIPAGKYKVVAWHPALNNRVPIEQELEVKDGASTSAKFEFKGLLITNDGDRALDAKSLDRIGKDGAPMVLVPAGEFLHRGDGYTQRKWLPAFYMDKYELTTSRYARFLQETGREQPLYWNKVRLVSDGGRPVIGVTWDDADAYCRWAGKRLPTEEEWQKAAWGTDDRKYPWGDEEPNRSLASYNWNGQRSWRGYSTLAKVRWYRSGTSPYGIYHMVGNVAEWTSSEGIRGGSWGDDVSSLKFFWLYAYQSGRGNQVGFRCAQDKPN